MGAWKTPVAWLPAPKSFPQGRLQAPKPFSCLYLVKIQKFCLGSHRKIQVRLLRFFGIFTKYKQGNGFGAWKLLWLFYIFPCNFQARKPFPCLHLVKTRNFFKNRAGDFLGPLNQIFVIFTKYKQGNGLGAWSRSRGLQNSPPWAAPGSQTLSQTA